MVAANKPEKLFSAEDITEIFDDKCSVDIITPLLDKWLDDNKEMVASLIVTKGEEYTFKFLNILSGIYLSGVKNAMQHVINVLRENEMLNYVDQ